MDAQYFLDFMNDELQSRLDDHEQQARDRLHHARSGA